MGSQWTETTPTSSHFPSKGNTSQLQSVPCTSTCHSVLLPFSKNISKAPAILVFENSQVRSAKCSTNWIPISQHISCIGQLKKFMHVTEVFIDISLHHKYNKFMKFRKLNRSAKAKPDSIFQTEQNVDGLVQRQNFYLCTYYIYIYI